MRSKGLSFLPAVFLVVFGFWATQVYSQSFDAVACQPGQELDKDFNCVSCESHGKIWNSEFGVCACPPCMADTRDGGCAPCSDKQECVVGMCVESLLAPPPVVGPEIPQASGFNFNVGRGRIAAIQEPEDVDELLVPLDAGADPVIIQDAGGFDLGGFDISSFGIGLVAGGITAIAANSIINNIINNNINNNQQVINNANNQLSQAEKKIDNRIKQLENNKTLPPRKARTAKSQKPPEEE